MQPKTLESSSHGHWPIQKLSGIQKLRFRNWNSETISADSETTIQKLFSKDSETIFDRFRNYFARFRNYFRPIQKLFSTDSETTIQKLFSKDSETIFDRFRNYFRRIQKLYISTDSETIFDRFRNYDSETIFDRFSNYDSETIFEGFRKFFSTDSDTTIGIPCCQAFCFYLFFVLPPLLLGNPCFQWFPPPLPFLATHAFKDFFKSIFSAPPPFLTTHAFNDFLIIKNFPPTLSWQPLLSML